MPCEVDAERCGPASRGSQFDIAAADRTTRLHPDSDRRVQEAEPTEAAEPNGLGDEGNAPSLGPRAGARSWRRRAFL
jgi:hypothetical protein